MIDKTIKEIQKIINIYEKKEISEKEAIERIQAKIDLVTFGYMNN